MGKQWVEHWLDPDDVLKEFEVDPDVFYDYFLSIPTVKSQRHFKEYKTQFLEKIKDGNAEEFAKDVGVPLDEVKESFDHWHAKYKEWKTLKWALKATQMKRDDPRTDEKAAKEFRAEANGLSQQVRGIESLLTKDIKEHFDKIPVGGAFDTLCIKFFWAVLINVVVIFMIYAIMNTISSSGLPGRQRLPESTSFRVILKVDPTVVTNKDRFDRPEAITDVCQGLGWWMEDPMFKLAKYTMPTDTALKDLTKKHWDENLNPGYNCPLVVQGLANKLLEKKNSGDCFNVAPESSTWAGDDETMEFFLFQDQNAYLTGALARKDIYHENGLTVTHTATNSQKQFTLMAGNYNGKVQNLQPIEPFNVTKYETFKPIPFTYNPFWVAQDRIWPSEWAVQALFTLDWNSDKAWDESVLVGGFNDFGRRPTAIVEANVGGSIGSVERNGYKIQEAIYQFLERRCWHTDVRTKDRGLSFESKPTSYSSMNQYDLKDEDFIHWVDLDQGLRDYWRALGLGLDTSKCPLVKTRVSTNTCIESADGSNCKRVNYHAVQRWNAYNDDKKAEINFNKRDFTNIFFEYQCYTESMNGKVLVKTPTTGAPTLIPLTWEKLKLAEDGKLFEAATALGYDKEEWDRHRSVPLSAPPDNLVLGMENYLEGEAYFSTYFWTQVICSLIMVSVSLIEIRHMFVWVELVHLRSLYNNPLNYFSKFNKSFVLFTSGFVAFFQYIVIPVFLVMVSLLLILESGSVTDAIKDTLSLLFLNEINNYLQIRNAPEAKKWKIMLKEERRSAVTRAKSLFTVLMFICFAFLGWGASETVYSGIFGNVHPSLLFNTLRWRPVPEGNVAWALYVITVGLVLGIFVVAMGVDWFLKFLEGLDWNSGWKSWFYRPYLAIQDTVTTVFNPQTDLDEDWWEPEPEPEPEPVEDRDIEDPTLRGKWHLSKIFNGKVVDVLINPANNIVLATRTPGDYSGQVTWMDPTVKPTALLGTPLVMTPPPLGAYSSAPVGTFSMAPVGAYPMSPPIISSAMPPPGKSFTGVA